MYEYIFKNFLFPLYENGVKRRATTKYLRDYERSQWLSPQDLAARQLKKLNELLTHGWLEVPYLRRFWSEHGVRPEPLRDIEELSRYPILTKAHIKENYDDMIARSWVGRTLHKTTGGSTGAPFRLEYTMESYAARTALMWRGYRWAGADLGRRTLYIWGLNLTGGSTASRRESLFHALYNRRMLNSFALSTGNVENYVKAINEYKPKVVIGYVAPLLVVAEWLLKNGANIRSPDAVITGAEALNESQRKVIEAGFGAPTFNTYGSREFGLIGAECADKRGLHVSADHMVVETVDDADVPVRGRPGHILITDLSNYGMPFVRYRIGDAARFSSAACSCGRGLPLFSEVNGRILDMIRTRDGRLLPGEYFPFLLNNFSFIRQYQVIQHDLDHIEIKLVPEPNQPREGLDRIDAELRNTLGSHVQVSINFVDELPLTMTGKRRTTISHVPALYTDS